MTATLRFTLPAPFDDCNALTYSSCIVILVFCFWSYHYFILNVISPPSLLWVPASCPLASHTHTPAAVELACGRSTKTIYIDHRPMMFSVAGLDSDENTFHTLGELEFEWVTPNLDGRSVISVVPYGSVSYYDDEMEKMELDGKRGSRVLVKGNHTGRGMLTVKMKDAEYGHVAVQQVELTVMPRMVLSPSDVYMVPTTSITFELFRVEQKQKDDWDETKTKVVLPDATYEPKPRFSVAVIDPGVVTLSDDGTVVADTLGSTRIVVNDALIQFGEHERSKQPGQTYPYCSLL